MRIFIVSLIQVLFLSVLSEVGFAQNQKVAVLFDVSGSMHSYYQGMSSSDLDAQMRQTLVNLLTGEGTPVMTYWNQEEGGTSEIGKRILLGSGIGTSATFDLTFIPFADVSGSFPYYSNIRTKRLVGKNELLPFVNPQYIDSVRLMTYDRSYNGWTYLALSRAVAWKELGKPSQMILIQISDFEADGLTEDQLPKEAKHLLYEFAHHEQKPDIVLTWKHDSRVELKVISYTFRPNAPGPSRQAIKLIRILSPGEASKVRGQVQLRWETIGGIEYYIVEVRSILNKSVVARQRVQGGTYAVNLPSGRYYARVVADGDPTIYSPNRYFEVVKSPSYLAWIFLVLVVLLIGFFVIEWLTSKRKSKEGLDE